MNEQTQTTIAPVVPGEGFRPLRIVLPGGSGQVGSVLARHFHEQGHAVTVLSRSGAEAPWRVVVWDGVHLRNWLRELENADVVINLAGRSVNCRYTAANRREILESRVGTTRLLGQAIRKLACPPRLWMNASTATIYRHTFDRAMDEATGEIGGNEPDAPALWRFSIEVATCWEECFFAAATPRTRKIALRSAMVMSPDQGGTFDLLLRLVRFGLGGAFGSGRQFMSWVHDRDFLRAVDYLIAYEEIDGPVNVATPGPLPNSEFLRALRDAWGRRIGWAAAEWMLEVGAIFLRTETELILKSRRVVPGRLLNAGFTFDFPEWPAAARDLVGRWRRQRKRESSEVETPEGEAAVSRLKPRLTRRDRNSLEDLAVRMATGVNDERAGEDAGRANTGGAEVHFALGGDGHALGHQPHRGASSCAAVSFTAAGAGG